MNINLVGLLIGAIAAVFFYYLAIWFLALIGLSIPTILIALLALLIFLGFATNKININR